MIATVVEGGLTGVNALLYGSGGGVDMNVLRNYSNTPLSSPSTSFVNAITGLNTLYSSDELARASREIILNHGSLLNHYDLTYITPNNITNANLMMQTVIMSNPEIIRLNNLGVINGFNNVVPDEDLFSFVNSGVATITDDYTSYTTVSGSAYDEYTEDDKSVILRAWETVNSLLAEGRDPTSEELDLI